MNRLDKELHERGIAKSRTAASNLISEGKVFVGGKVFTKPSHLVCESDDIEIRGEKPRYVSRGGFKLEHALKTFNLSLDNLVCLDVGASTGGFTDCMLQNKAKIVYSVDVGRGQLDETLKSNSRVVPLERCDIRSDDTFNRVCELEKVDFCSVDVSFISLKLVLPELLRFLKPNANSHIVSLIKPQFELGKKHSGIITDKKIHLKIINDISDFAAGIGFTVKTVIESPITGGGVGNKEGNREFLMLLAL